MLGTHSLPVLENSGSATTIGDLGPRPWKVFKMEPQQKWNALHSFHEHQIRTEFSQKVHISDVTSHVATSGGSTK